MQEIIIRNIYAPSHLESFHIIRFEDIYLDKNMEEGLHRHDFFFLMILDKASGKHHVDFKEIPVAANTVTFLRPGQVHELILQKGSKGYLITFSSKYYGNLLLAKVTQKNFYTFNQFGFGNILSTSKNIFKEFKEKSKGFENVIKANLDILLILLDRENSKQTNFYNTQTLEEQEILDNLILQIEQHVFEKKRVSDYANVLHQTPYKLNSVTKKLLGKTCSQMINEQIVLESKRLLLATSNQINEIAYKLGYEDPAYFIRFFKKHTGHTPKSFRKNFKKVLFL